MQVKQIASNMTVLSTDEVDVLFSYSTPVAAFVAGEGFFRTDKQWSATTSRHINKWLGSASNARKRPQEWFDNLLKVERVR